MARLMNTWVDSAPVKCLHIEPNLLTPFFIEGREMHTLCDKGLPEDAQLVRWGYDQDTKQFVLIYASLAWPHVQLGDEVPEVDVNLDHAKAPPRPRMRAILRPEAITVLQ